MEGFGARLRSLRTENNLTQKSLATILNVSIPTLSHWECDYQEPSFKDLTNLGKTLNVSIDYLLGLEDDFGARLAPIHSADTDITAEERQLIDDFRKLNFYKQKLIKDNIKAMLPAEAESEQKKKKV